ncbi:2-phospho-L-lactate guanylyltransferase [Natronorarus salvus]|uniref:2-phospho-L-lactate guanylyltransferase n=1 Tax=Natronorarus salvus TaxID=3117733 RepID=UPI002F262D73
MPAPERAKVGRVVVPYDAREPCTRLSPVLDPDERWDFSRAMLADVLGAVRAAGYDPELLATAPIDVDAPVTVDERSLTPAVNDALSPGTAVVMADLALATPGTLSRLFEAEGDVVLVPGRGGGTNALVSRHPEFRVDYHDGSFLKHRRIADDSGISCRVVDSHRLATDIDEPGDLVEVLIHGEGRGRKWLREAGFELSGRWGHLGLSRDGEPVEASR